MIVWLASYPRSGNTLLRSMLWNVWGIGAYSVYGHSSGDVNPDVGVKIGHRCLGCSFQQAYERISRSTDPHFLKTHEIPIDDAKAIYIVRDGRSACRSFCHFRHDFNGLRNDKANLRDILLGFTSFGSWSSHLDAWNPITRPNTLLVKYEQLLEDPETQVLRIARFIEREPRRRWHNNFDEMARMEPRLFRAGAANDPQRALDPTETELFWTLHGRWMRELGYVPANFTAPVPQAAHSFCAALHRSAAEHVLRLNHAEARAALNSQEQNYAPQSA